LDFKATCHSSTILLTHHFLRPAIFIILIFHLFTFLNSNHFRDFMSQLSVRLAHSFLFSAFFFFSNPAFSSISIVSASTSFYRIAAFHRNK
jgi:hypothetical protein